MRFCTNSAIFHELCDLLRFLVNYAKLQHRIISEALSKDINFVKLFDFSVVLIIQLHNIYSQVAFLRS